MTNTTLRDCLVGLWEANDRSYVTPEWHRHEDMFRIRLHDAIENRFGDLARLVRGLTWTTRTSFQDCLEAQAEIPGSRIRLSWRKDLIEVYAFYASASDGNGGVNLHILDSRLKLARLLYEEEPFEGDENYAG